jgi:hypothetical protein
LACTILPYRTLQEEIRWLEAVRAEATKRSDPTQTLKPPKRRMRIGKGPVEEERRLRVAFGTVRLLAALGTPESAAARHSA